MKRGAAGKKKKEARRRQGGRNKREDKDTTDSRDLGVDGEGRWQRMKLYTHNDPAALYPVDKAAWQPMKLHEADPDVLAYQEIRLQGKDNVVCAQMYDKEGREYQREWAQGVPLLVRRGLSVVQDKKVGARGRRAVYDVATEHGQVVIINCHVPHRRRVKEYVAQLRMGYVRALERGPVIVVGDFKYDPRRRGAETEVDRQVRKFVEEMRLQDVSYSGAPDPSHYPAPEGSAPSRIDAVYADPSWVKGVPAGYMVGPEEMQDRKGHCPMMVTVDVKVGEPGDEQEDWQGSDEEGVSLPPMVKCPEEGDERWQQWEQRVHAEMRQGKQVHQAMRRAARICGFTKQGGESQAKPKLQRLVATLRKRQQEEVEARAREEGTEWQTEVTQAKKRVRTARRAVEEEHERIYQKVVAEHERYMERAVPYKSLRYIRELAEAGKPKEIRAVRLQCGRITGNKKEVLEELAQSFRRQHNQGQQELSGITRRMVRALPRMFTAEQSEDIHRSRVTLGEIEEALKALKGKKSLGVDQLVAEAYQHLEAPELDGLAGRVTEVFSTGEPPKEWGDKVRPLYKKGDHLRPGNWRPICCAVTEAKLVRMVIFGRIQRRLYAAGVIPDNMWGSVLGRSTQEASFLYDMYLDDEDLEAFMASVDVKRAFPNTPHRLIEEMWRQLGLPYGDFVEKYLRSRRYTVATGKGCTEWVTPGSGVPQGGVEGPFLYLLAMLPLMSWIAREYPQLARAPHTSPPQAYVDDAVPMARDEKAQQVVQDLMQRYGRDNHLVWSAEKSAVLGRGGEEGMALDVGDGVAWLERAEEAVVLGHVQAMEARGVRLPDKLVRGFRAMLMVLWHHPPSVQTTLYYLRAVLNAAVQR